ncbi:uncharacterized protein LOC130703715 [Daphnia carinata]|uniref:uncharacterized protein LOC130703715 n=1 Tax=Daphnia carinata TaxID=120202 RepID=UPI00257C71DA|nr:uncharacterized protein LOC130703715 [Daphnia carinata]
MKVVFLASIFVFAAYTSVCHGLPTPEVDPYRYKTGIDIQRTGADWRKVGTVDKPHNMGFPEKNGKGGPNYPDTFFGAYRMNPNYRSEDDPLYFWLAQVPKQTPYNPIPYAVYYQLSADDVAVYDNGISY